MDIIVAVDEKWGIGKDGDLLHPISADLKYFRQKTTGNVLVMGRKTLESFPNKKPLPNRVNIVLTKNKEYAAEGVVLAVTRSVFVGGRLRVGQQGETLYEIPFGYYFALRKKLPAIGAARVIVIH